MAEEIKNKPDAEEILRVEHLKKYFPIEKNLFGKPTAYLRAVDDVSFTVKRGTTIGIVGESGCGKTTLGRTILRLYDVDDGKISRATILPTCPADRCRNTAPRSSWYSRIRIPVFLPV